MWVDQWDGFSLKVRDAYDLGAGELDPLSREVLM